MKPKEIKETLRTAIKAGRPVHIWGPPGVGKSDFVRQVVYEMYGGPLEDKLRDVRHS